MIPDYQLIDKVLNREPVQQLHQWVVDCSRLSSSPSAVPLTYIYPHNNTQHVSNRSRHARTACKRSRVPILQTLFQILLLDSKKWKKLCFYSNPISPVQIHIKLMPQSQPHQWKWACYGCAGGPLKLSRSWSALRACRAKCPITCF